MTTNGGFARIGNTVAKEQFNAITKALKISGSLKHEFSKYIHMLKDSVGRGGSDNYSYQELIQIGKEFLSIYGKK